MNINVYHYLQILLQQPKKHHWSNITEYLKNSLGEYLLNLDNNTMNISILYHFYIIRLKK